MYSLYSSIQKEHLFYTHATVKSVTIKKKNIGNIGI